MVRKNGEGIMERGGEGATRHGAGGSAKHDGESAASGSASHSSNDYFRMGAAVAVGELYDAGRLGEKTEVAGEVRSFLKSFGINSIEDVHALGVTGPYIEDFRALYC